MESFFSFLLFWGENERGEENVFREREKEERVRTCCSLRGKKEKSRIVSRQSRVPTLDIIRDYFIFIEHFNE